PWGIQQSVDDPFEGLGRLVRDKFAGFLGSGWKTGQVKCGSPDQRTFVGEVRRLQMFLFELGQNEGIERGLNRLFIFYARERRLPDRLKRPMRHPLIWSCLTGGSPASPRVWGAYLHPMLE